MNSKNCLNCSRKVSKDFIFCPYCGINIKKEEERRGYGFLGLNDELDSMDLNSLGFGGIFNNLVKELTRQMSSMGGLDENLFRKGFSVSIGNLNGKPVMKVGKFAKPVKEMVEIKPKNFIDNKKIKRLNELPRKEATAEVRRLSNKIIYEINMPGVRSLKDIIINKLENSIEIRAISDENSYFKTLPINLPIVSYGLEKGKLVLELKPQN